MYKLIGHSLTKGEQFAPESQSMTLTERGSTSTITLGPGDPEIGFNDWILDDDWPEGTYVWRVKSIDDVPGEETVTVQLEHAIRTLEDIKLFDDMDADGPAREAVVGLLGNQSDWTLGDFDHPPLSLPYEFNGGSSIFDGIESVSETLEDAEWWYDMTQYPFRLHIRKRDNAVYSEMRGGRNLSTLKRTLNRSGMYTRIWPVGENDLHLTELYLSRNENIYGRIDRIETDEGKSSEAILRAWADARLKRHCEPNVTITISGLELSQETGESLDWIQLNRVCRCPLPEYNTTIEERVIKLNWKDRRKEPENVTVTLSNAAADVTTLTSQVSETSKYSGSGGSAARGQAKQNYMFEVNGEHLLYEVFDECGHLHGVLRMTEQSLRVAFENLNECTRSEFYLTSESLRVQFENEIACTRSEFQMTSESLRVSFENEIECTRSQLEMTSESLRAEFQAADSSIRSALELTAQSLRTSFENELTSTRSEFAITSESLRVSFESQIGSARSAIDANAQQIALKVSKGDVATQLAVEAGNVSISGGNLVVDGMVTATSVQAAIANLNSLQVSGITSTGNITLTGGGVVAPSFRFSGGGNSVGDAIYAFGTATESGGQITIPTTTLDGGVGGSINFNIAATQYYQDGVAAARTAGWNGCAATIEVYPDEDTALGYSDSQNVRVTYTNASGNTTLLSNFNITSPADRYSSGVTAGKAAMGVTADTTNHTVKVVESDTKSLEITCVKSAMTYSSTNHNYAYVFNAKAGSSTMAAASGTTGTEAYDAGVLAGEAKFTLASVTLQGSSRSVTPISSTSIKVNSTAGTFYKKGTVGGYYKGNGGAITGRGTAVTRYSAGEEKTYYLRKTSSSKKFTHYMDVTLYRKTGTDTYTSAGNHDWWYAGSGTTYFEANGSATVTLQGSSGTYYLGDGASGYLRGDSINITPIGDAVTAYESNNSGTTYYTAGTALTLYNAGTTVSDTYYTKS